MRVENNRRRVVCLTCGQQIPACHGQRVDDRKTGELRGYRHPACPEPKFTRSRSPRRDPHALGAHVLRIKHGRYGPAGDRRVCGVRGCKYAEYWDQTAADWRPIVQGAASEPALVNAELWA